MPPLKLNDQNDLTKFLFSYMQTSPYHAKILIRNITTDATLSGELGGNEEHVDIE